MSTFRRRANWPFGVTSVAVPSAVIFAVTVLSTSNMWDWRYQLWVQTSRQVHEQLILVGPVAAAVAAYYAGRLTPPTRIFAQPSALRSGPQVAQRHLHLIGSAALLSYVLGFVPLFVLTALRAEAERPYILPILDGLAGLTALVGLGYLVGVLTRSAWPAPVVFVAAFVALQSTAYYHDTFAAIDPVIHFDAGLGRTEAIPLTLYRLAFFLLILIVSVMFAARALTRQKRIVVPSPGAVGLLVLVAVAVAAPIIWKPALVTEEGDPPAVCDHSGQLTYCVHAGRRSDLPAIRRAATQVLRVTGPPPRTVTRVRDTALATPGGDQLAADTIWLHLYPDEPVRQSVTIAVADAVAGVNACTARYGAVRPIPAPKALALQLAAVMEKRAGYSTTVQPSGFKHMTDSELRAWIREHRHAIATCSLTIHQMP